MTKLDGENLPDEKEIPSVSLPEGKVPQGPDLPKVITDTKSSLNKALAQRKIDIVSDEYRRALDDFLREFISADAYSQRVIGMALIGRADSDVLTLPLLREVY